MAGGYTSGVFGKLALITAAVPFASGEVTGRVSEDAQTIYRNGLTDSRLKLSVNLVGNPAMRARAFAKASRKAIVGTSLTVTAPVGEYDRTKLINLGTNPGGEPEPAHRPGQTATPRPIPRYHSPGQKTNLVTTPRPGPPSHA